MFIIKKNGKHEHEYMWTERSARNYATQLRAADMEYRLYEITSSSRMIDEFSYE
jgi:hypothetical protein